MCSEEDFKIIDINTSCPACGSSDFEVLDIMNVFEKFDTDSQYEYYLAEFELTCLICGEVFTSTGTVIKRKEVEE